MPKREEEQRKGLGPESCMRNEGDARRGESERNLIGPEGRPSVQLTWAGERV